MSIIAHSSSTQSRHTRPGTLTTTRYCSGVYERTPDGRNILSWPLGQHGALLGYPSLSNKYTTDLVLRLTDLMNSGYASLGSYAPEIEEQLACRLESIYHNYLTSPDNQVRFFANGTDANQCAIALARYITGSKYIISVGYHGGSSPVFNFPPQDGGTLKDKEYAFNVPFENYLEAKFIWDDIAALIVEVPPMRDEEQCRQILRQMEKDCFDHNVIFIMDEVVTGFRYALAGASEYYNLKPTMVTLGKSLSTYGKVSALLAPKRMMNVLAKSVFASYTYNDHPLGLHDAMLTIDAYEQLGTTLYSHIDEIGGALKRELNELFAKYDFPAEVIGHNSRTSLVGNQTRITELCAKVIDQHNILLHRPQFAVMPHCIDDVLKTKRAVESVLQEINNDR